MHRGTPALISETVQPRAQTALTALWVEVGVNAAIVALQFLPIAPGIIESVTGGLVILHLATFWLSSCLFLSWLSAAYQSIFSMLPRTGLRSSPLFVIASCIMPPVSMFLPYLFVKQIWLASDPRGTAGGDIMEQNVPIDLPAWWTFWLLHAGAVMFIIVFPQVTSTWTTRWFALPSALLLLSTYFTIRIVRSTTQREVHKIHMVTTS